MFSPTGLLVMLLSALALFGTGVSIGYKWEVRANAAAVAAAQKQAIDDANKAVDAATQRTLASAKAEADERVKVNARRHKGEIDAVLKSRPQCARDDESLQLLNSAIDAANGQDGTSSVVPSVVRQPVEASGWLGTFRSAVGISSGGAVRPMSPPAR